jgi:hypothetical protein
LAGLEALGGPVLDAGGLCRDVDGASSRSRACIVLGALIIEGASGATRHGHGLSLHVPDKYLD